MFEIVDNEVSGPIIKVIGVGGAGGNAVARAPIVGVQKRRITRAEASG
jgi:hypothetical protein